jgi:F-box/leucine-rich repeat protein 10/11
MRILEGKTIKDDPFQRLKGNAVGLEWLAEDEGAMREPIVIESPDGLGLKMPPNDFTVDDVVQLIGDNTPVEVIGMS